MKPVILVSILFLSAFLGLSQSIPAQPPPRPLVISVETLTDREVRERVLSISVMVGEFKPDGSVSWYGSGVLVSECEVLTAAHVCEDTSADYLIQGRDGIWCVGKSDTVADLCLLKLRSGPYGPYKTTWLGLAPSLSNGEEVYNAGYPDAWDLYITRGYATVSLVDPVLWNGSYLAIPGNSGSGVFNLSGQLVGIHTQGYAVRGQIVQFMKKFVPLGVIRKFMESGS